MSAVQLPVDYHGRPLCRHDRPGRCTWWCTYRRAVVCIGPVVAAIVVGGLVLWLTGDRGDREAVENAAAGVGLFLAATVPVAMYANAAGERT